MSPAVVRPWALRALTALLLVGCSSPDLLILDSSGKAIEGAKVVGTSLSIGGQTTFSDKKGRASIPSGVQPTKWISVYKDGFAPVVNIDVAQTRPIVVRMQRKNGQPRSPTGLGASASGSVRASPADRQR